MKIIPAIDVMEGKVVRLYRGDPSKKTVYSDNPLEIASKWQSAGACLLYTSPSPRDRSVSRMPSSA